MEQVRGGEKKYHETNKCFIVTYLRIFQGKRLKKLKHAVSVDRTRDLQIFSLTLSQLSYPRWVIHCDSKLYIKHMNYIYLKYKSLIVGFFVSFSMCMYVCMYVCISQCVYVCMCVYVCIFMNMYMPFMGLQAEFFSSNSSSRSIGMDPQHN